MTMNATANFQRRRKLPRRAAAVLAAASALCAAPAQAWDDFGDLFDWGLHKTGIVWIGGDYKLASGSYKSETAVLGDEVWWSHGTVWQTGGSWVTDSLQLGSASGWVGIYTLDGGLLATGSTSVGNSNGRGTFTQNGGSHLITGELGIGGTSCCRTSTHGSYDMAGGALIAGSLRVGAYSDWTQTDGSALFGTGGVVMPYGKLVLQAGQLVTGGTLEVQRAGGSSLRGMMSFSGGVLVGTLGIAGDLDVTGGDLRGLLDNRPYGQTTIDGIFSPDAGIRNAGTLTITGTSRITLEGAGLVNLAGGVLAQAGRMEGSAAWLNQGSATLAGEMAGSGGMNNSGSVTIGRGLNITRSGGVANSGSWEMHASVLTLGSGVEMTNTGTLLLDRSRIAGRGTLVNAGAGKFTSRGNGSIETAFVNNGRGTVQAGTLTLVAGLGNEGTLVLSDARSALAGGSITNRGSISGQGRIDNAISQRGLLRAEGGTLALYGALDLLSSSRIEVAAGSTLSVAGGDLRLVGSAQLEAGQAGQAPATLRVAGALDQDGTLSGTGRVEAASLRNAGTLHFTDGPSAIAGALDNRSTGRIELADAAQLHFEDAVTLRAGSLLAIAPTASVTFESALTLEPGARVTGRGMAVVDAALELGSGAMGLQFDGGVVFGAASRYHAQIGSAGYDRLAAASGIGFDGTLVLELLPGFTAQAGERFQLFSAGQYGGAFVQIDTRAAALPAGLAWDFSALSTQGVLGVSAVPEPGSWALLYGGLMGLGLRARGGRRRR